MKKIILWLLTIACMVGIFAFSSQSAVESTDLSDGLLYDILMFFNLDFSNEAIMFLSVFIRKAAHFSVYAVLGALVYLLTDVGYGNFGKKGALITSVTCLLYAASDEAHQIFVPGRSGQIVDVVIDFSGALCGMMVALLICALIRRRKNG